MNLLSIPRNLSSIMEYLITIGCWITSTGNLMEKPFKTNIRLLNPIHTGYDEIVKMSMKMWAYMKTYIKVQCIVGISYICNPCI